jgi:hypothetical protein
MRHRGCSRPAVGQLRRRRSSARPCLLGPSWVHACSPSPCPARNPSRGSACRCGCGGRHFRSPFLWPLAPATPPPRDRWRGTQTALIAGFVGPLQPPASTSTSMSMLAPVGRRHRRNPGANDSVFFSECRGHQLPWWCCCDDVADATRLRLLPTAYCELNFPLLCLWVVCCSSLLVDSVP